MYHVLMVEIQKKKKKIGHWINFLEISSLLGDTIVYNDLFK